MRENIAGLFRGIWHTGHIETHNEENGIKQFDQTIAAVVRALPQKTPEAVRRWLGAAGPTRAQLRAIQSTARMLSTQRGERKEERD